MVFTVTTTVMVALAPLARFPTSHVGEIQVPTDGVTLTNEYPDGILSITLTPVAKLGPLFVAVIVKVMLLPIKGVALFTVFMIDRSVTGTGIVILVEVLFPGSGSCSLPVMVAVLE